jgi:hypothetical protein
LLTPCNSCNITIGAHRTRFKQGGEPPPCVGHGALSPVLGPVRRLRRRSRRVESGAVANRSRAKVGGYASGEVPTTNSRALRRAGIPLAVLTRTRPGD